MIRFKCKLWFDLRAVWRAQNEPFHFICIALRSMLRALQLSLITPQVVGQVCYALEWEKGTGNPPAYYSTVSNFGNRNRSRNRYSEIAIIPIQLERCDLIITLYNQHLAVDCRFCRVMTNRYVNMYVCVYTCTLYIYSMTVVCDHIAVYSFCRTQHDFVIQLRWEVRKPLNCGPQTTTKETKTTTTQQQQQLQQQQL